MANSKYRNKLAGKGKNTRKKSNSSTGRNYDYDKAYAARPDQKKNRAKRNAARRLVVKSKGKSAVKGKDVDHKRPIAKGGSNKMSNLRVTTKKKNRSRK